MDSRATDRDCTNSENGGRFPGSDSQHCSMKEYLQAETVKHFNWVNKSTSIAVLHVITAGSILWFIQMVAITEQPGKLRHIDTGIRDFPSTENLPAGHTISPLYVCTWQTPEFHHAR